ncbi:MAG: carbohydrate ABC transporter permease [Hungatella sp.]|nr:carbohydrate ABC transporter permease [Hungatella sp.]
MKRIRHMEKPDLILNIIILLGAVLNLFPLYWLITSSFKTSAAIYKMPPDWFPTTFNIGNYRDLFVGQPAFRWAFNSILVSTVSTVLVIVFSSLAAYSFSKLQFKGKNALYMVFICSLMLPKEIFIVPLFKIVQALEWSDTYMGMIAPTVASCFGVFLLKGFFDTVPDSIRESGKIDGASELTIFTKLVLPIVKPGLGALFILNFVNVWNDYLWQMLMARTKNMRTLMVGTASLMQEINPNFAYKMAGATVACVPMLVVFLLFQRYFTAGITVGAEKG